MWAALAFRERLGDFDATKTTVRPIDKELTHCQNITILFLGFLDINGLNSPLYHGNYSTPKHAK